MDETILNDLKISNLSKLKFAGYRFYIVFHEKAQLNKYNGPFLRAAFGDALKEIVCKKPDPKIQEVKNQVCEACIHNTACIQTQIFDTSKYYKKEYFSINHKDLKKLENEGLSNEAIRLLSHFLNKVFTKKDFENALSSLKISEQQKGLIMKYGAKQQSLPNPFVIGEGKLDGDSPYFDIILIGQVIEYLPEIIKSVKKMGEFGLGGKRYNFSLGMVDFIKPGGLNEEIYNLRKTDIKEHKPLSAEDFQPEIGKELKITFKTPLTIRNKSKLIEEPDFHNLIKSLLFRISDLMATHTGFKLDKVYSDELVEESKTITVKAKNFGPVVEVISNSKRKDRKTVLRGIIGNITFSGKLRKFMPVLLIGQYIHTGNSTTFGFGEYEISQGNG